MQAVPQTPMPDDNSQFPALSLLPENKRVSFPDNPEDPVSGTDSLERRMQADLDQKQQDPLYDPSANRSQPDGDKPAVPERFVTPKLVVVQRNTLKKRANKLKRPRRPAPPPPPGVDPYRSLSRSKVKPPPPPQRRVPPKAVKRPGVPPPPPQRKVVPKKIVPNSPSHSQSSKPSQSSPPGRGPNQITGKPVNQSAAVKPRAPNRPAPSRPAPPPPPGIDNRRQQPMGSLASLASTGSTSSYIPPPAMFMDSVRKGKYWFNDFVYLKDNKSIIIY